MDEHIRQEAEALIEHALVRNGLITVMLHRLGCRDDPSARMVTAEL